LQKPSTITNPDAIYKSFRALCPVLDSGPINCIIVSIKVLPATVREEED
jgi:hypothetical protein